MKEIKLNKGYVALVDDQDYEYLSNFNWKVMKGEGGHLYARADVFMHREVGNVRQRSIYVDHIDGNGLNNCRSNLRSCTQSQNMANTGHRNTKNRTSKYKGVCRSKASKKWLAQIHCQGVKYHLGSFETEIAAAKAYNAAALEMFGSFAKTNNI